MSEELPGDLIRYYREKREWTGEELARKIGISPSYLSLIESGKRPVPKRHALRFTTVLGFADEHREYFLRALGVDEEMDAYHEEQLDRNWLAAVQDAYHRHPLIRALRHKPRTLADWLRGRAHIGRFNPKRAIPPLNKVINRHRSGRDPITPELYAIVLNDAADAYAMAGHLAQAQAFAEESAAVCNGLGVTRSATVGLARALSRQQQIAYQRGDEGSCWDLHTRVLPLVEAVGDHYGWYHTLYFLALYRLWQGRLSEAQEYLRDAYRHAVQIRFERDFWWGVRDGFFLGAHWCQAPALSLWLDVLACDGQSSSEDFTSLYLEYSRARWGLQWTRDFPPFVMRYAWLDETTPLEVRRHDQDFRAWMDKTARLGCLFLNLEIRISYGDFLLWGKRDEASARRMYQFVYETAGRHQYQLLKETVAGRLEHHDSSFVAFNRRIASYRG